MCIENHISDSGDFHLTAQDFLDLTFTEKPAWFTVRGLLAPHSSADIHYFTFLLQ